MKNILYLGNALSQKGKTTTYIEILSEKLSEFSSVKVASSKSNKLLRMLDMIRLLISNRSSTDYVLIDTYSTLNFYYALIISQLCRLFKLKYIPILHGGNLEERLKKSPKMSRQIFVSAYKLVTPSHFLKHVFNNYDYTNLTYIPNTIELENYKFKKRDVNTINLLWVRSFNEIYNPVLALKVVKLIAEKGHDISLTMVGPGQNDLFQDCKNFAKKHQLNVTFTGKLSKSAWVSLSEKCNIFINTTNIDNTPISVIEAMALGLPIVSTNVGGLPYLIDSGVEGLLTKPDSEQDMVNAILNLRNDSNLVSKLTKNARQKVEQFDWNVVKTKWEVLLS